MKIEFFENESGIWFELEPETVTESNQLLRFASNASSKKPEVWYSFRNAIPSCSISLSKVKHSVQVGAVQSKKLA